MDKLISEFLICREKSLIEQTFYFSEYHGLSDKISLNFNDLENFIVDLNNLLLDFVNNQYEVNLHTFWDEYHEAIDCSNSLFSLLKYYQSNCIKILKDNVSSIDHSIVHVNDKIHEFYTNLESAWLSKIGYKESLVDVSNPWSSRFKALFEHPEEGVFITDKNGIILDINEKYQQITGYTKDEIVGCTPRILKSGRHDQFFYAQMWSMLQKSGIWSGMIYNKKKDDSIYLEKLTIKTIYDEKGNIKNYIAHFSDQSETDASQKALLNLARYDDLTGLINKKLFNIRLNRAIARNSHYSRKFCIILIDLDNFNDVNNTFGHRYGDIVLKTISQRLKKQIRVQDTLARYGGDEFAVLLEYDESVSCLEQISCAMLNEISKPITVDGNEFIVTSGLGIAVYPDDGENAEELMKNVHVATYESKNKGVNSLMFYNRTMTDDVKEKLTLTHDLHLALERNEFELYYQPLIATINQKVLGVEALIRWNHPHKGIIPPMDFIKIAEETHQIIAIGDWVLRTACNQLKEWNESGLFKGFMAVNISGIQLLKNGFDLIVKEVLEDSGVDSSLLELEITETQMMDHLDEAIETLEAIQKLGVRISIDDFGTGYSSLGHLRKLPINKLKIDRQFIKEVHNSTDDKEISKAIISMAKALKLDVLAEGIEEQEQLHYLLSQGCEMGQGYYFSHPLKKLDFLKFLENR